MSLLEELKHSIKTHLLMMGGPTPQLCVFAIKIIDFLEDGDAERRDKEMGQLAFSMVEAIALYVYQSVEYGRQAAEKDKRSWPAALQTNNDNLLLLLGRCRGLDDKIEAKYLVLKRVAMLLADFGTYSNSKYPTITDVAGNPL